MSIVQWLLLILVIAVVAGTYWYLRSQAENDPWQNMDELEDEPDHAIDERGESLNGDSYVVGVRTLSKETPATRKAVARGEAPPVETPRTRRSVFEARDQPDRPDAAQSESESEAGPAGKRRLFEAGATDEDAPIIDEPPAPFPEVDTPPGSEPGELESEPDSEAAPRSESETAQSAAPPRRAGPSPRDREPDRTRAEQAPPGPEPEFDAQPGSTEAESTGAEREAQREPTPQVDMRAQAPPTGEQQIFLLYVASADGRFFSGPAVHAALESQRLRFGLNDVFHRVTEVHGVAESVFGVANMLKPGTLDPADREELATPGLTLYLIVPGPLEGTRAMRDMMETANGLASVLGGEVLDDKRTRLKAQSAQYMLDQIAELDRRARLTHRRG